MNSWLGARAERATTRLMQGLVAATTVAASVSFFAGSPAWASSVSPGSVTINGSNGNTAGATATSYAVSFSTSVLGALSSGSTITFLAPNGTAFPTPASCSGGCSGYSLQSGGGNITGVVTSKVNGSATPNKVVMTVSTGLLGISGTITVDISSVVNPTASGTYTIIESTSVDQTAVQSNPYTIAPDVPKTLTVSSGSGQSAAVGQSYSTLVAHLVDKYGNPTPGQSVTFTAPSSGASVTFGSPASNQSVVSTDTGGNATSAVPKANTKAGSFKVTATFGSLSPVLFSLDNVSGPIANLTISGNNQSADAGTQFAKPLQVLATDQYQNPEVGTPVVFIAPASGPSVTFAGCSQSPAPNQCTVLTGPTGTASPSVLANSQVGGPYNVSASTGGLTQNFSLTNLLGPPSQVIPVAGSGQQVLVSSGFQSLLAVQVTDIAGNPVPGATVTFSAPGSGASATFAPCSAGNPSLNECVVRSDPNGYAASSPLTAGGTPGSYNVVASVAGASSATFSLTNLGSGYRIVASDGGVFTFGGAPFYGSTGAIHLNRPIVGMANTRQGGYYLVASDGGIFSFGPGATFYGSTGALHLNAPVVGMAIDPQTGGYWLVASDGGVFSFNAPFWGSMGAQHLNAPIVGISATPQGGYYLVASDGGIFSFGPGATFYGSAGALQLNAPIVAMATSPDGGYWLVASDGGIFTFGPGPEFFGSAGNDQLNRPIVSMAVDPGTGGYWLVASDGGVFSFGAPFYGSTGGIPLNAPIVGIAPSA